MSGLARLLFAALGCALRQLAGLPLGLGAALVRGAARCERRALGRGAGRAPPG